MPKYTNLNESKRVNNAANTMQQQRNLKDMMPMKNVAGASDNTSETLKKLLAEMSTMNKRFADFQSSVSELINVEISKREKVWKEENDLLKMRISALESREEARQRNEKRNNVVLRGLVCNSAEYLYKVNDFLYNKLELQVKVLEVIPIKERNSSKSNPNSADDNHNLLILKLASYEDKLQIMRCKASKLKGTQFSISSDLTQKERETQKYLSRIAEQERKKGKTVKVAYRKLFIDDRKWILKDGDNLTLVDAGKRSPVPRNDLSQFSPNNSSTQQ